MVDVERFEKIVELYNELVKPVTSCKVAALSKEVGANFIDLSYGRDSFRQRADGYNSLYLMKRLLDSSVTEDILK